MLASPPVFYPAPAAPAPDFITEALHVLHVPLHVHIQVHVHMHVHGLNASTCSVVLLFEKKSRWRHFDHFSQSDGESAWSGEVVLLRL